MPLRPAQVPAPTAAAAATCWTRGRSACITRASCCSSGLCGRCMTSCQPGSRLSLGAAGSQMRGCWLGRPWCCTRRTVKVGGLVAFSASSAHLCHVAAKTVGSAVLFVICLAEFGGLPARPCMRTHGRDSFKETAFVTSLVEVETWRLTPF
jgi:hypothetical protein